MPCTQAHPSNDIMRLSNLSSKDQDTLLRAVPGWGSPVPLQTGFCVPVCQGGVPLRWRGPGRGRKAVSCRVGQVGVEEFSVQLHIFIHNA